jgi:hypothetical protein
MTVLKITENSDLLIALMTVKKDLNTNPKTSFFKSSSCVESYICEGKSLVFMMKVKKTN